MKKTISLCENWTYRSQDNKYSGVTRLPSCNYADLYKDGHIPNPYTACNETAVRWVAESDWTYSTVFVVDDSADSISLNFGAIDTFADVYLNDRLLDSVENAYLGYRYEVKDILVKGENTLCVRFHSPIAVAMERQAKLNLPGCGGVMDGYNTVRKPGCHYGWDWGPFLPISGLVKPIYLEYYDGGRLTGVHAYTNVAEDGVRLNVKAEKELFGEDKAEFRFVLLAPDGSKVAETCGEAEVSLRIDNPQMWYACGMKRERQKQPLYTLNTSLLLNGVSVDERTERVGLRTIELWTEPDDDGTDFCFAVNGERIFAKGANWIPGDSMITQYTRERLERDIINMRDASFNMIRVWGGGYYESDEFYELCDEYGILIWQDGCFACAPYPFNEEWFVSSVVKEIEYNARRLRNHASLALWNGNNEIESNRGWVLQRPEMVAADRKFFYETMPSIIKTVDGNTPYWGGSPSSGTYRTKVESDKFGDTHIWAVWHRFLPASHYYTRISHFCSEFGFVSFPSFDGIKCFATEKDFKLNSDVMLCHQKCLLGNDKLQYYMISDYRIPQDFRHLIYLSQLSHAESMRLGVEHWRRHIGRCNGALYWQYNDCWPTLSGASVDYTGKYKALQYFATEFFKPVEISILVKKASISFTAVNDSVENFFGRAEVGIMTFDGTEVCRCEHNVALGHYSSTVCGNLARKQYGASKLKNLVAYAFLYDSDGKQISSCCALLVKDRRAKLAKPNIIKTITKVDDSLTITLKSDTFVRRLMLDVDDCNGVFSSNYIDMLPNKEYVVKLNARDMDAKTLEKKLTTISIADVCPRYPRLVEKLIQARIMIVPENSLGMLANKYKKVYED